MFNEVCENGTRGRSMRYEMKAWRFVTRAEHLLAFHGDRCRCMITMAAWIWILWITHVDLESFRPSTSTVAGFTSGWNTYFNARALNAYAVHRCPLLSMCSMTYATCCHQFHNYFMHVMHFQICTATKVFWSRRASPAAPSRMRCPCDQWHPTHRGCGVVMAQRTKLSGWICRLQSPKCSTWFDMCWAPYDFTSKFHGTFWTPYASLGSLLSICSNCLSANFGSEEGKAA